MNKPTQTPQVYIDRINAMVDKMESPLSNLYSRWQDEREYEDFTDYARAMQSALPAGFTFITAQKRPFGLRFGVEGCGANVYALTVTARTLAWKRVR